MIYEPHSCNTCCKGIYPGQEYLVYGDSHFHHQPTCESQQLVVEPPLDWKDQKYYKYRLPRLLRSYVRRTEKERECWRCNDFFQSVIYEGECYEGQVWLTEKGIKVTFQHFPECPWQDEPFEEDSGSGELIVMKKKVTVPKLGLAKAA